ncbi:hypothetical protein BN439_1396 [Erwinia amylovora Ea644]|nr:hypothetical protein BN439_1396 [Erwinia amylovora Ea644]CCP06482.1 hypothetical protein BN440_1440 [Erwinia amylovora MR1]
MQLGTLAKFSERLTCALARRRSSPSTTLTAAGVSSSDSPPRCLITIRDGYCP